MKYIRISALALCVLMLALLTAGSESGSVFRDGIDTDSAMKTYSPDTVMLSSADLTITWGEFYFLLHDTASQLTGGFTEDVDWTELLPDGTGTWADLLKSYVTDQAVQSLVFKYGIAENRVALDDYELESLYAAIDSMIDDAESLASLEQELKLSGIYDISVYEILLTNFFLQDKLPSVLYGDTYDNISDEVVEEFAIRNEYMLAKHILITFLSEYDGYTQQEIEDAKSEAFIMLDGLLDDLAQYGSGESLNARFDELVAEHSEDPGSFNFPDGYLFQPQDMVEPFSEACMELDYFDISGIVETSYGYHVILRLPLDYDNIIPISLASSGQYYSLRQLAVFDDYEFKLYIWLGSMTIEPSPELEALDVGELFKWHD